MALRSSSSPEIQQHSDGRLHGPAGSPATLCSLNAPRACRDRRACSGPTTARPSRSSSASATTSKGLVDVPRANSTHTRQLTAACATFAFLPVLHGAASPVLQNYLGRRSRLSRAATEGVTTLRHSSRHTGCLAKVAQHQKGAWNAVECGREALSARLPVPHHPAVCRCVPRVITEECTCALIAALVHPALCVSFCACLDVVRRSNVES